MSNSLAVAGVALTAAIAALAQQTPAPVSLSGTVVNTATGAPVRFARVAIMESGDHVATAADVETDAAGAFQFPRLDPGEYRVWAAKTGFIAPDGQRPGYEVSLTASRDKFEIGLAPLASIRGRITNEAGEPVEGATVLALRSEIENGRRRHQVVKAVATDDRGEYRVPLLPAGSYVIKAGGQSAHRSYYGNNAPPPALRESFVPVYFGGSHDTAAATLIPLRPGAEARADFSVTFKPGHVIRGRITNFQTAPHRPVAVVDGRRGSGPHRRFD
jgi:hypothetical protein